MDSVSRYLVSPTVGFPRGKTTAKLQVGCPIRRSLDQSPFPAPQCLSQGITSFIASCCQGIHQTPFSRLIRSRDGQGVSIRATRKIKEAPFCVAPHLVQTACNPAGPPLVGSHTFPAPWPGKATGHSVSVLDLEQNRRRRVSRRPQVTPTLEGTSGSDVSLSSRCKFVQLDGSAPSGAERSSRRSPWWSLSGSNRRPPACKAGALPAELRPQAGEWWVEEDPSRAPQRNGGSRRTRTSDLTLIRRAL